VIGLDMIWHDLYRCSGLNDVIQRPTTPHVDSESETEPRLCATEDSGCASIRVRQQINRRQDHFRKRGQGTSQRHIYRRDYRLPDYPLSISKPNKTAIAEALSDADALIESLEQLLTKKRQIKQGAMQELLTGKKRLPGFQSKPGYKQTEMSARFRTDWLVVSIRDVAEKITVGFVGSMAHLFTDQGIPLLRGQNVLANQLDLNETKFISPETHKQWKKSALEPGDVVMVRVGYPGTSCVIPDGLGEANAASLVVVRPNTSKLSAHFLSMIVNSQDGKRQIDSYLVGGAQQVINTGTAAMFKLRLPSLPEQTAIVAILSDMDADIAALETKLATAQQIKQGMMQELLTGRIRLV
jgi:type I restriction enzyme S subunit